MNSYFQNGPCIEIYSTSKFLYIILNLDETLIKKWKLFGKNEKGYETNSKSYFHHLINTNSKMQCPPNEKDSINIFNNILIFQFLILNQKSFSIEVRVTDNIDSKFRFNFSTSYKGIEIHEFHILIPLNNLIPNFWTNLYIDIGSLLSQRFKNQTIKCIDYISINGCCKIRKIFAIKNINDPLNKSILLSKNTIIKNMKIDNINSGLENYNIIVPNTTSTNINFVSLSDNLNQEYNGQLNNNNKVNKTYQPNKKIESPKKVKKDEQNNNNINGLIITNSNKNINQNSKKLQDTLKQRTKESLKFAKKLPEFKSINNQIQYKAKSNKINTNNTSKIAGMIKLGEDDKQRKNLEKDNKIKQSYNINKQQENKKENLIKNQNDNNINENKFGFGYYEMMKQPTLNESIEEIYDYKDNPLQESILVKAPEINTQTNIKKEDIIHIDDYKNVINKAEKILNEIDNNNNNENDDKLSFFDNLEIDDFREKLNNDNNNRPYSPPIGKMIPVDDNKNNFINDRDLNPLLNSMSSIASISTKINNKAINNYENLIYDEKKGKYYDSINNIYYDIKNK